MVEATIQVIRETEAKAEAIVKDAENRCREIIQKAAKEAEELKADQIREVKQSAEADMTRAKEQGTQYQKKAMSDVDSEVEALKTLASAKEEEAAGLVISQLV